MPRVEIPNVGLVDFPEDMSLDEIRSESERLHNRSVQAAPDIEQTAPTTGIGSARTAESRAERRAPYDAMLRDALDSPPMGNENLPMELRRRFSEPGPYLPKDPVDVPHTMDPAVVGDGSHTPVPVDPRAGGVIKRPRTFLQAGAERQAQMKALTQGLFPGLRDVASGVLSGDKERLGRGAIGTLGAVGGALTYPMAPLGGMAEEALARAGFGPGVQEGGAVLAESLPGFGATGWMRAAQAAGREFHPAARAVVEFAGGATEPNLSSSDDMMRFVADTQRRQAARSADRAAFFGVDPGRPPSVVTSPPKVVDPYAPVQNPVMPPPRAKGVREPNAEIDSVMREYATARNIPHDPPAPVKVDPSTAQRIAQVYESTPPMHDDPEVQRAYEAFNRETEEQFHTLISKGYSIEPWRGEGQPYKNSAEMREDVRKNKHLYYFETEVSDASGTPTHPLITPLQNDMFRAVHDIVGHAWRGNEFGPNGEENAWMAHSRLYSPEAQRAMTTETRAQNSAVNFGKDGEWNRANPGQTRYVEQKAMILPDEFLPEAARRTSAPAAAVPTSGAPKKKIRVEHLTPTRGLTEITPDQYGTGALSMSERKRGAPPATFFYREGTEPEAKVLARARGGEVLTSEIDEDLLRKFEGTVPDPDAMRDVGNDMTAREFALAKERAAYEGQYGIVKSFGERHPVIARRDVPGAVAPEKGTVAPETGTPTRGAVGIEIVNRKTGESRVFQSDGGMHALAIDKLTLQELEDVARGRAEFRAGRFDANGKLVPNDRTTVRAQDTAEQLYKLRLRNPDVRELPPVLAKAKEWADGVIRETRDPNKKYDIGGAVVMGVKQINAYAIEAAVFIHRNAPTRAEFIRIFGNMYQLTKEQARDLWERAIYNLKDMIEETSGRLITRQQMADGINKGNPFWYEEGAPEVAKRVEGIFESHPDARGVVKPVGLELAEQGAVASLQRAVRRAEELGLDAMLNRRLGVPNSDELERFGNYQKYVKTGVPGGPKVGPFAEARYAGVLGEAPMGKSVIDRHILREGGMSEHRVNRPRNLHRLFMQGMFDQEAAERAVAGHPANTPVRAQSALWTSKEDIDKGSIRPWAKIVGDVLDEGGEERIRKALKEKKDLDEATSFGFGANVKEMHTFPSLKALEDAGARVRDTGYTREIKERFGTREERYQAIYNDKGTGSAIREAEGQMEARVALQQAKDSEYVRTLTEGLTPERRTATFDVGEAIREFDDKGDPVFGATKVDGSVRYDAATGKKMWDDLSADEQNLVRIVKAAYEHQKETENVISTVVGYMPHVKAHEVASTWDKLRYLWEPPGTAETLSRPRSKNQPTVLRAQKAGPRMKRTDADDDYVHDIASSLEYSLHQFTREREYNRFLKKLVLVGTRPYDPKVGLISKDWMVIPRLAETRSGKLIGQVGGGRQIPKNMWAEIKPRVDHAEATKQVGELVSVFRDLGNYSRMNMLTLNPGSVSRNFVGGGIQYGTMMLEHLFRGMLDLDLSQFTNDVKGLADAFRLDVIKERPEGMFGARANTRTQYDPPATKLGEWSQKGMTPFAEVENYFKRAIMQSQLRQVGAHKLTAEQLADNSALIARANRAIDQWAFNYSEIPKGLEGLRRSALGSLAMPFPVYGYKISRMYGRYLAALNPVVEMSRKDRAARILTLAAIAAPILYMRSKTKGDTLERGRVAVGGGYGYRTMETPWLGPIANPIMTGQQMISVGPLASAAAAYAGRPDQYQMKKPGDVIAGETLASFLPGARITSSVRDIIEAHKGNKRAFPENFGQATMRAIPGTPTKGKRKGRTLEPDLEYLKFIGGINLERGHERKR